MPYEIATVGIQAAIIAILEADTLLASLIATKPTAKGGGPAIYPDGEVPQGQTFPYLTIGSWTQVPFHSFSPSGDGYGWNCTVQIKAIGQRSQEQLLTVMSTVFELLPQGQALVVSGYDSAWTDEFTLHPALKEILSGVTTFHVPAILRVYVK